MSKLGLDFYLNPDVVAVARNLLGKKLCTQINETFTSGIITETEAYEGVTDKACHAYNGRYTPRTATMYKQGGTCYIYLCYGVHHLFNIVTNQKDIPHAVLIRAIFPLDGIEYMRIRRNKTSAGCLALAKGPGTMSKALGLHTNLNETSLLENTIWIENANPIEDTHVMVTPRIGVGYAKEDALLPYRFVIKSPEKIWPVID